MDKKMTTHLWKLGLFRVLGLRLRVRRVQWELRACRTYGLTSAIGEKSEVRERKKDQHCLLCNAAMCFAEYLQWIRNTLEKACSAQQSLLKDVECERGKSS